MEQWKNIEGYEGLYQISNCGRVKSFYNGKELIMKLGTNEKGYSRVSLWKNHKKKDYKVHRLVAEAFLDNPDNLTEINHKDEDKSNNNVDNLEWCSHQYNINFGTAIQRRVNKISKTTYQYTLDGKLIREWKSTSEIEQQLGYCRGHIGKCCNGKLKTAYGYVWTYNVYCRL